LIGLFFANYLSQSMDIQHHTISVQRTAHYYVLGKPGANIRQFWIICHGYAQLADEFLENFRLLDDHHTLIVAPEGMNHFYRKGFEGPVGATWMTRRHRDGQIQDYSGFLQALYQQYRVLLPQDVQVIVLGFSQGTATVCRWILRGQPDFQHLVLWGGLPPEDLNYPAYGNYLQDKTLDFLWGDKDPFLTPERMAFYQEIKTKNKLHFQETSFAGGHEILSDVLLKLQESFYLRADG